MDTEQNDQLTTIYNDYDVNILKISIHYALKSIDNVPNFAEIQSELITMYSQLDSTTANASMVRFGELSKLIKEGDIDKVAQTHAIRNRTLKITATLFIVGVLMVSGVYNFARLLF